MVSVCGSLRQEKGRSSNPAVPDDTQVVQGDAQDSYIQELFLPEDYTI